MKKYSSVDEYLADLPAYLRQKLELVRKIILKNAPGASEKISYGIPTYYLNGNLLHFAGYKTHVGLYPGSKAITHFASQLKTYETSKGTIRIPLDQPLPLDLIAEVTVYRVTQNLNK